MIFPAQEQVLVMYPLSRRDSKGTFYNPAIDHYWDDWLSQRPRIGKTRNL
jgi:hypothetical protein